MSTITGKAERNAATDEVTTSIMEQLSEQFAGRDVGDQGRYQVVEQDARPQADNRRRVAHRRSWHV